jgi:hypothetical protein
MQYQSNKAGKSTREMAERRRKTALWIGLSGIVVLGILWFVLNNASAWKIGGLGIFFLFILMIFIRNIVEGLLNKKFKEQKRAIRGAKAEEKIGDLLDNLTEDFLVLNDIPSPYGNIDHIVIAKYGGIFLLETKAHGGNVQVDGETLLVNGKLPEKNFINQTLRNTYWLLDVTSKIVGSKPWITPIIVFTNAFVPQLQPVKGVSIINKRFLLSTLNQRKKSSALNDVLWEKREEIMKICLQ